MNPANFLRDTIDLVKQIETRFLELAARLYNIKDKEMWKSSYESYQEFLDTAKINPGHASILASIHKAYVVEGKMTVEKLAGIGYSNLYEALPLLEKESVSKVVEKARLLTRSEIKDEVRDEKHGAHTHKPGTARWASCETCGKLFQV
jgi:hypothetical protein